MLRDEIQEPEHMTINCAVALGAVGCQAMHPHTPDSGETQMERSCCEWYYRQRGALPIAGAL
jgi:hypothetical protein